MNYEICKGNHRILGVHVNGSVTSFSVKNNEEKECVLVLYPKSGDKPERISMQKDEGGTSIYSVGLRNLRRENYDYAYELDGVQTLDPYAERIVGREQWADPGRYKEKIKCGFNNSNFSWNKDVLPRVPKQDMVMYKLHVRGFSMLQKLPEDEKGTFRGVERKLSYLQELGVTTVEFMPVYEFEEFFAQDSFQHEMFPADKINYWGYTRGDYFAVKAAYLGAGNTSEAFKRLIRTMHKKGMEAVLEFYFDEKLNPYYIIDVLRYWAREYHVDGFHVICNPQIAQLIAEDYQLGGRKLFFDWFDESVCAPGKHEPELFTYNDAFMYGVRKLMNHHGGTVQEFADNMRRQQKHQGFVNYLAINNGFSLYDLFSYTEKQNQLNGEENHDGVSWNCSNNCGEEGPSRKKHVNQLRERQVRNALCTVMLAQGIPLIWMGDECGNSQNGNNNAYCQDNEIGWKSWDATKRSRELTAFVKGLAEIRRKHPALRNPLPMQLADYRRIGYPDLSYHGTAGWQMEPDGNMSIGMLYACDYAEENELNRIGVDAGEEQKLNQDYIYVGYNFSPCAQALALPALPKDYRWYFVLNTNEENGFAEQALELDIRSFDVAGMSVCMLVGRREETGGVKGAKPRTGKAKNRA